MSNLILLQTTMSAAESAAAILLFAALACVSLLVIVRRKLASLPPMLRRPEVAVLSFAAALGVTTYLAAGAAAGALSGLLERSPSPDAMRLSIMWMPVVQLIAAAAMFVVLSVDLPSVHWVKGIWRHVKSGAGGYLLAIPCVLLTGAITALVAQRIDPEASTKHIIFDLWLGQGAGFTWYKALAVVSACAGAPIVEELFFRGILQRLLVGIGGSPAFAIVVTSELFMAIHSPWTGVPSIFVLSLFLGWVCFRSGSVLASITMHIIFNAMQFAYFLTLMPVGPVIRS